MFVFMAAVAVAAPATLIAALVGVEPIEPPMFVVVPVMKRLPPIWSCVSVRAL